MIEMEREIVTSATPATVFAYLADFTTTEQWEPGTVSATRVAGDGGVGTRYANTARFAGRTADVEYEVIGVTPGRSIQLRAEHDSLIAHDTLTVRPHEGGSRVTYRVEFSFRGWLRLGEPLLRIPVANLMDGGVEGLQRELAKIAA